MGYQAGPNLPMTPEDVKAWWTRIDLADAAMKEHHDAWDKLAEAYLPSKDAEAINSNVHFRNTEQKKSKLFFRNPELRLTALAPITSHLDPNGQPRVGPDGQPMTAEDIVALKQAVLNKKLGRDGVNVARLFRKLLFDALQCSGMAVTLVSYDCDIQETPDVDPMTGEPVSVPVPVYEDWTLTRISPKKLLVPHDFHDTDYDKAPWLGYKFTKPLADAKREYGLPDDFVANATTDDAIIKHKGNEAGRGAEGKSELVEGVVIWLRAAQFDPQVRHRQVQRYLVLIKKLEQPAKYTDSPYQTIGPSGKLTHDSLTVYPIRVLHIRELSDSAVIPADAAFTDPLIKQRNTWRSQSIKLRDANIPRFLFDEQIKTALEALRTADVGEGASVAAGVLAQGIDKLIAELPKLEKAMADIDGERAIDRDIDQTLAVGSNQGGIENDKVLSATEVSVMQGNSTERLEAEQTVVTEYYLDLVRAYDTLLMRFADEEDYVEVIDRGGARRLMAWNKDLIAAKCAYDIKPDSQLRLDAAQDRKQALDFTNFTAKSPVVDQIENMRDLALKFGRNPEKLVHPPEPSGPPPPNVSVKVAIADLAGPAGSAALKILQQAGYQLTEEDLMTAQANQAVVLAAEAAAQSASAEHGGAADKADVLSKHSADETGKLTGPTDQARPM